MTVEGGLLFAQFNFTEEMLWGLRFLAGLVGALLGWYASGPLLRLLYRVSFRRPIPGWLLPWGRLGAAVGLALLAFFFLPLGSGSSGLGWGPGHGGGPGLGSAAPPSAVNKDSAVPPRSKSAREIVDIEMLGGKNYPGEGRYYLLNRTGPPRSLEEIKEYLAKKGDKIEVHIVLTEQSVAPNHGAVARLRDLLDRDHIPTIETVVGEAAPDKR
jgi:hypothetical protein